MPAKTFNSGHGFLAIIIIFAGIHIAGCIDAPESQTEDITGFVYTPYGLPHAAAEISIGDYPIVYSDKSGKFQLLYTISPYNLNIIGNNYRSIKYLGMKNTNPKLNIFYGHGGIGFNIIVSVPPYNENQTVILKFISDDASYSETEYQPWDEGDTVIWMGAYFDPGYKTTRGKLVYLLVTGIPETGIITSYDAFGTKDIELTFNIYNRFSFTPQEVSYNPTEVNTDVLIESPPADYNECSFYVHLNGKDKCNDLLLEIIKEPFTNVILPVLPFDFKIKSVSEYFWVRPNEIRGSKWIYTNPGENIHIVHNEPLNLLYPENEQRGITDTTKFIVEDNGINGIYLFNILAYATVVTDKNFITLADFETRGFRFYPDHSYDWDVVKIPGYNSIDEFTAVNYVFDNKFDYIQISNYRSFSTSNDR